ncbi:hypothetical protein H9L21_07400 [Aeromicrobium senzhongii]|uniref:Nuclease SbcCD subunit C n=1 Tax=Aeromicrobium senzhongii TaxID=2663859 RepID=A0ABX6SWD0_9ACTN|nr:ATP-binding protein [Aeromicrobium senzhongii]MTB87209.1 hypothetical protein [Aeromicrobium senzhongii]QNL95716.1 hypothetical protein H9L21_07400 [Aeromicrobium senzhongii]
MTSITLRSLAVVGSGVPPAVVEFGDDLTVVHGASDTGKSFVFNAIDYMLGGKSIRHVRELDAYDTALLALTLADGTEWTLSRGLNGGAFQLYNGLHLVEPTAGGEKLAAKHHSENDENVSAWLLAKSGIGRRRIRKNASNATVGLSFRDVVRLCMVDEVEAISTHSPVETGQFTSRTKERSAFRVILEDSDDASLVDISSASDRTKSTKSQQDALGRLLGRLQEETGSSLERPQVEEQLERLDLSLTDAIGNLTSAATEAERIQTAQAQLSRTLREVGDSISDRQTLIARFSLLGEAYQSDLERLDAVEELGSLLGFFGEDTCPFCGAPSTAWEHAEVEGDVLRGLVESERDKIRLLGSQLQDTLRAMQVDLAADEENLANLRASHDALVAELAELNGRVSPISVEMREVMDLQNQLRERVARWDQIAEIEEFRDTLGETESPEAEPSSSPLGSLSEFERQMELVLRAWEVPGVDSVAFDQTNWDLVVGGRPRAERGAGMRALLHAAFTVSFAEFCIDNERPHPGFVVLDSPLVTYRDPEDETSVDFVGGQVADAFYSYLGNQFSGQAIVFENTQPPGAGLGSALLHTFTRSKKKGRYGFFPLSAED